MGILDQTIATCLVIMSFTFIAHLLWLFYEIDIILITVTLVGMFLKFFIAALKIYHFEFDDTFIVPAFR
jgi:hypothetical protein